MGLSELTEKMAAVRAEMQQAGRAAVEDEVAGFFAKHPCAKSIAWRQYTPYFNAGDACTFSVNEPELQVYLDQMAQEVRDYVGDSEQEESSAIYALQKLSESNARYCPEQLKGKQRRLTAQESALVEDFGKLSHAIQDAEDTLEQAFGDHVKVICTRDGIEVREYDHE